MDGLEESVKKSHAMKQSISERNPESNFQINLKEVDQGSKDNSDDINAGHDKCFSAFGKEISEDEYQYI